MAIPSDQSYIKKVIDVENKQLTYFTEKSQTELNKEESHKLFFNLSIKQILENISAVFVAIVNELVSGQDNSFKDYIMIFFKDNRMIYIGLLIIIVAFFIYIVDITG